MMARKTLVEQLDDIQFSAAAEDMACQLSRHSATDEMGVVVLTAAALLIAGQCPGHHQASTAELARLCTEFGDLVTRMHGEIEARLEGRPVLRVVGGTDRDRADLGGTA